MEVSAPSLLIADTDHRFINQILKDPLAQKNPPLVIKSDMEWIRFTERSNRQLDGIFFNPNSFLQNGLAILVLAHEKYLGVPMYVLSDGAPPPWNATEFEQLGFSGLVRKPVSYRELFKKCTPKQTAEMMEIDSRKFSLEEEHPEFSRIYSRIFLKGKNSEFDIFVQTEKNHFVKILALGDTLDEVRLRNYLAQGVSHFYIKKSEHEKFLHHICQLSTAVLHDRGVSVPLQIQQTLSFGDQVRSFLKNQRIQDREISFCEEVLKDVVKVTCELDLKRYLTLTELRDQIAMHEHSVSGAFIALLLARCLGFQSKKILVNLGTAALLHDLGLKKQLEDTAILHDPEWIRKQSPDFFRHPIDSAMLLEKMGKRLDPTIPVSVLQHHERRDGKGFPYQLGTGKISLFSEILGVSDLLVHLLVDAPRDDAHKTASLHQRLNLELRTGFSGAVAKMVESKLMTK